jgi:phenylacetaldehyde dehydrogenase
VHSSIYERVIDGIAQIARTLKLGPALSPDTQMGPLVSKAQQERVLGYIRSGEADGATVVVGGKSLPGPGAYVQPTILTDVKPTMKCVREEIFGPVLAAARFDDVGDVIQRANDTTFGLGASVWTESLNTAHRFIRQFKSGTVWINTHGVLDLAVPFGGIKQSGIGHELGEEAVNHHTTLKSVLASLKEPG